MANRFHSEVHPDRLKGSKGKPSMGKKKEAPMPEKTASWPGVPGPTQPRDRSAGVKKVKQWPHHEGV